MLADDTAGLLEALGIERAAVLGHSMGGFVAQALTLGRPDLVNKLILCSSNFGGPNRVPESPEAMAILLDTEIDPVERMRRGILVACAPGFGDAHPEFVEEWITYRLENPMTPAAYQAQLAIGLMLMDSEEAAFEHKLKNIQVPTLCLFGEHDKVVPPGNAELLAREIPNCTIHLLSNAGHVFMFEVPNEAVKALVEFLKG
jgi:pimeloyl-ACP methyl ester carboxylesterase